MAKGVLGVSFNVVKTSDAKLLLEYNKVDPINRTNDKFITIHEDYDGLAGELKRVLGSASVL